jgi:hypothetical protein
MVSGLLLIGASVLFIVSYVMKFPRSRRVSGFLRGYFLQTIFYGYLQLRRRRGYVLVPEL